VIVALHADRTGVVRTVPATATAVVVGHVRLQAPAVIGIARRVCRGAALRLRLRLLRRRALHLRAGTGPADRVAEGVRARVRAARRLHG